MSENEVERTLERLRSEYGKRDNPGIGLYLAGGASSLRFSEQGDNGDQRAFDNASSTIGASDPDIGAFDSGVRWDSAEVGDSVSGSGEVEPDVTRGNQGVEGDRAGAGRSGTRGHIKIGKKPQGLAGTPSFAEQKERPVVTGQELPTDVIKIMKVTKDGKREQVKQRNGLWAWRDRIPEHAVSTPPAGPKVVVDHTPRVQTPPTRKSTPSPASRIVDAAASIVDALPTPSIKMKGVLSEREAREYQDQLEEALVVWFDLSDKIFVATLQGHPEIAFFSDMDEADITFLAKWRITHGKSDTRAAAAVRGMISIHTHLKAGEILVPRFIKLWQAYTTYGFEAPGGKNWRKQMRSITSR